MNNKTKQQQIREELQSMKITDSHCGLPFSMSDVQIDTIMAIFAREQAEMLRDLLDHYTVNITTADEKMTFKRLVPDTIIKMKIDDLTTQLPEEKEVIQAHPYICSVMDCGATFAKEEDAQAHWKSKHPEKYLEEPAALIPRTQEHLEAYRKKLEIRNQFREQIRQAVKKAKGEV